MPDRSWMSTISLRSNAILRWCQRRCSYLFFVLAMSLPSSFFWGVGDAFVVVYRDNNPVGDVDIDNNGDGVGDVKCFSVSTTASASATTIASGVSITASASATSIASSACQQRRLHQRRQLLRQRVNNGVCVSAVNCLDSGRCCCRRICQLRRWCRRCYSLKAVLTALASAILFVVLFDGGDCV